MLMRGKGVKRKVRAIIDSGSQRSYIFKNVGGNEIQFQTERLTGEGHTLRDLKKNCIHLAEELVGPIDVLIGANVAGKLIILNHLRLESGLITTEAKLGWAGIDHVNDQRSGLIITSMLATSVCIFELWALDSLGITDLSEKKTTIELQEAAKQHLLDAEVAPITKDRIRDAAVFEIVGVNLVGPFYFISQKKTSLLMQFFELASDISSDSFLLVLRRLVARRGRCIAIYCDNGTNFAKADNLLKTL
ncbi:integrase catalytic domain-containing protein [Trichonephila clavipes]|nr:integrase catalytic domain-containing protein [Trichonephila clavipes]